MLALTGGLSGLAAFILSEVLRVLIGPDQVEVLATEHFHEGPAAFVRDLGHSGYHYLLQPLYARRLYVSLVHAFKVVDISNLGGLSNTPAVLEALPPVVSDGVCSVVSESTEHQEGGDGGASPTLACVAVHYHYVVHVF